MAAEFVWYDDEATKPMVMEHPRRTLWPWALGLVLGLAIVYGVLRLNADRNEALVRADLSTVLSLEAQALARGDGEVLAQFQDPSSPAFRSPMTPLSGLSVRMGKAALEGDWARADVTWITPAGSRQSQEFFHRIGSHWFHAAPAGAWGVPQEQQISGWRFIAPKHDARLVQSVGVDLVNWSHEVCRTLSCPNFDPPITVEWQARAIEPVIEGEIVRLPAPDLHGLEPDGQPSVEWTNEAHSTLLRTLVFRSLMPTRFADISGSVRFSMLSFLAEQYKLPNPPQRAGLFGGEIMQWLTEHYGPEAPAQVLAGVRATIDPQNHLPPEDWRPYFQYRLNYELQLYRNNQFDFLKRLQLRNGFGSLDTWAQPPDRPIEVSSVRMVGDRARVTAEWRKTEPIQSSEFFVRQNGTWLHVDPVIGFLEGP